MDTNKDCQLYEFEALKFVVCNKLPFSTIDSLIELLKNLYRKGLIIQSCFSSLDRTKGREIVSNVITEQIKKELELITDNNFFNLVVDEVSGRFGKEYLGIAHPLCLGKN